MEPKLGYQYRQKLPFLGSGEFAEGADVRIWFSSSLIGQRWCDLGPQIHGTKPIWHASIKPGFHPFVCNASSDRELDGVKTLRTQDTSDPRHFGTSAEVSERHFGTKEDTSAPRYIRSA